MAFESVNTLNRTGAAALQAILANLTGQGEALLFLLREYSYNLAHA